MKKKAAWRYGQYNESGQRTGEENGSMDCLMKKKRKKSWTMT